MSVTKKPSVRDGKLAAPLPHQPEAGDQVEPLPPELLDRLTAKVESRFAPMFALYETTPHAAAEDLALTAHWTEALRSLIRDMAMEIRTVTAPVREPASHSLLLTTIAENMGQSIAALGPALAEIQTPVSPQLAHSMAATERAWRDLETEFGLLTSLDVSELVGSKSPNRSYASDLRNKGKMIAVKRPGGLRYPGFQIDREEHAIRPVMENLIRTAEAAGRTQASLALWMTSPTGYLQGDRPVDQLSQPDKVVEAAEQSFGVQW